MSGGEEAKVVLASDIGLIGWPETFKHDGREWSKDEITAAKDGEIQCVEYYAEVGDGSRTWLVIVNE